MPAACHAATASTRAPRIGVYQRRRPERTVAYEAVQQQMESWLSRHQLEHPDGEMVHWLMRLSSIFCAKKDYWQPLIKQFASKNFRSLLAIARRSQGLMKLHLLYESAHLCDDL